MTDRKLVVLGIPQDVDIEGLREYMSKFGELEDCIVLKERSTGRSCGFGYATYVTAEDAKAALTREHLLGNRMLEVKVATHKEEMKTSSKKITRIFVARIPPSVTEAVFRSHFEKYGEITDLYMPKDPLPKVIAGLGLSLSCMLKRWMILWLRLMKGLLSLVSSLAWCAYLVFNIYFIRYSLDQPFPCQAVDGLEV